VLPAWATVVVALGGAAIGAIAGVTGSYFTLRGARINIEHSEREAWRTRLIQASEEFSQAAAEANTRLGHVLNHPGDPLDEAAQRGDEFQEDRQALVHTWIRVALLFGNDSPADSAARLTTFSYMRAYAALDEQSMDLAGRQFSEAGTAAREFLSAANEAILPSTAMHR
jgi:hypothetical protein